MLTGNETIVFQGDSITDAGRSRDNTTANAPQALGTGYACYAAALLRTDRPSELTIYNRGISGNQVTDLANRWQADCLDLKPDVLSILIGVNDTWHGTAKGVPENGTSLDVYESTYRELLDQTKQINPAVKLVLCEPFVTEAGAVLEMNFHPEIDQRRAIVKRIADAYGALFVPFQSMFDKACDKAGPAYWAGDGVHPSMAGHMLMAQTWVDLVLADGND